MCLKGGTHTRICLGIGELFQVRNEYINWLTYLIHINCLNIGSRINIALLNFGFMWRSKVLGNAIVEIGLWMWDAVSIIFERIHLSWEGARCLWALLPPLPPHEVGRRNHIMYRLKFSGALVVQLAYSKQVTFKRGIMSTGGGVTIGILKPHEIINYRFNLIRWG